MLAGLVALIPTILGFVVLYFVVKAAVVKGMEIAAWRVEPSIPLCDTARDAGGLSCALSGSGGRGGDR